MIPQSRTKTVAMTVVAVVAVSALGYWGYGAYREYEQRMAITTLVKDASERLRDALNNEAEARLASIPDTVTRLETRAAEIARDYATFRQMTLSSVPEFREAADGYLLAGRETLRRVAAIHRFRMLLSESKDALLTHMRSDRGAPSWPGEVVRARQRVDENYREYKAASEALAKVIESLPAAQAQIAPYVDRMVLIDERLVNEARRRVLETLRQTTHEVKKITNLDAYR